MLTSNISPGKAIEYYKKAINLKPHHVLYFGLGGAYERQGNFDEAITAYQESIKIRPTFTYGLYSLALIYSKQDRYQDAIELLRKVVELEPRNTFAQHALGMVHIQTGERTGRHAAVLSTEKPRLKSRHRSAGPNSQIASSPTPTGW